MSADLSQELRRHDAIEQLINDVFTVIHLEGRQGQVEVALIIEAHVASQLKEEAKEMPHAALVAGILRQVRDGLVQAAKIGRSTCEPAHNVTHSDQATTLSIRRPC